MLTIIHGADFHLDSPFSGLSPQLATQKRQEQRQLLSRLAEIVAEKHAQFLLLSGDLFDGDQIYRDTVEALSSALAAVPCPVLIAAGNHDYYSPRSPYATTQWSENVHIFSTDSVEAVEFPAQNAVVYGASFTAPHMANSPLEGFSAPNDGKIHLMTLHGALDGDSYAPISQEMISGSGLHYLALGHVHQYSGLQKSGNTHYAYSGCPQGRGFDELGEKGVLCITIDDTISSEFIPLAQTSYEISTVDVTDVDNIQSAIVSAIPEDTKGDCYRILLTGTTAQQINVPALEKILAPRFFSLQIRDHSRPPLDVWQGRGEDNLRGLFLAEMAARGADSDPALQLALKYGLSALEQREDVAP